MVKSENSSWLKDSTRAGSGSASLAGCAVKSELKLLLSLSLSCNIEIELMQCTKNLHLQLPSKQFNVILYIVASNYLKFNITF